MKTLNLGNNETVSSGIAVNHDGTFTAMTFSRSKTFRTLRGAERWIARIAPPAVRRVYLGQGDTRTIATQGDDVTMFSDGTVMPTWVLLAGAKSGLYIIE